ncbi:MAG: outer membrane lipoprotein-sorting protein [Spirochaetia bacterium]|nr:outer membrane lipoprotein-sorting protein [Spirochaetia bacterium]
MNFQLKHCGLVLIVFLVGFSPLLAQSAAEQRPDIEQVVNAIDRLYRHDSSHTLMEMEIHTPHWSRTLKLEAWSEGMDKTFIRILQPQKERGMGTLRIDNEMWNYLPKTNKVMKIPPSMMMSSWMGSDFKNNDLVKEFTFTEDYTFEYIRPDEEKKGLIYLKCIPKPGKPIVWGHVLVAVDVQTLIPKWEEYYDEHDELMRIMYFKEVENFDGTQLPSIMELVPQTKDGHKTVLRYIEAEFDVQIERRIFTLRHLRTFRR